MSTAIWLGILLILTSFLLFIAKAREGYRVLTLGWFMLLVFIVTNLVLLAS